MQLGCRLNERNSTKMDSDQVNIFTLPLCPTGNPNLYLICNCLQRSKPKPNQKKKRNLACKFNSITKWHRSEMLHPVLFPQRHEGANGNIRQSIRCGRTLCVADQNVSHPIGPLNIPWQRTARR